MVRFIIHVVHVYSVKTYDWAVALLDRWDSCIENFSWTGNIDRIKHVTLAWKKVYSNIFVCALGMQKVDDLNKKVESLLD